MIQEVLEMVSQILDEMIPIREPPWHEARPDSLHRQRHWPDPG